VGYGVSANPSSEPRTATITVGGQSVSVRQEGSQASATGFGLTAVARCWEGNSSYPPGPGIVLSWQDLTWPTRYEVLRDGVLIGTARGGDSYFYNVMGLTAGRAYRYRVRALSSTASVLSAEAAATAPAGCPSGTELRVESLTPASAQLISGASTTVKLRLNRQAPSGGAVVTLTSSRPILSLPSSVLVPEGQNTALIQVTAGTTMMYAPTILTAAYGRSTVSTMLGIKPSAGSQTGVAYLLLHGLNSSSNAWKDLILDRFGHCDRLKIVSGDTANPFRAEHDGQIRASSYTINQPSNGCYALDFNSSESLLPGFGDWDSGDGLTYDQLGMQVKAAVDLIVREWNPHTIVLVGHSRGGLAARAYLQDLNMSTTYRKALVTIGTPHLGSPFGRIKLWMDSKGYKWTDTLATTQQLAMLLNSPLAALGAEVVRQNLKFVFSPSTGYLAASHSADGGLIWNPHLWALDLKRGKLRDTVDAAGQIVSTGLGLGESLYLGCNAFSWAGACPPLATLLPGDSSELEAYVKENITTGPAAGWSTNTDGVVPAASARMGGDWFRPGVQLVTRYLDRIPHADGMTEQTACILEVMDVTVYGMAAGGAGGEATSAAAAGEGRTAGQKGGRSAARHEEGEDVRQARQKAAELGAAPLVEQALEGMRTNTLEGLVSRQEIRRRQEDGQREIVEQVRRWLADPDARVRGRAVRLLGETQVREAVEAAVGVLKGDKDAGVRREAAAAILAMAELAGEGPVRQHLREALGRLAGEVGGEQEQAWLAGVEGLVALGGRGEVERLVELWESLGEGARQVVQQRMGALRNPEGVERLTEYLAEDPQLGRERTRLAGEVLSEASTEEAVRGLLGWALQIDGEPQRAEAVQWLKKVRTVRGRAALTEVVAHGQFRSMELRQQLADMVANSGQCTLDPVTPIQ
jgi:HEAT repeat protein/pimeloyl-ACP methyl ester carboxylesterase